jgi:vacuolar-type H+-ATPase subunit I/STV1
MKLNEIINGLKDLIRDRESFIKSDEPDGIFAYDKKVLQAAINVIKSQQQEIDQLKAKLENLKYEVQREEQFKAQIAAMRELNRR